MKTGMRGTTLIETLITSAFFAIIVLAIFAVFDIGRMKWAWMDLGRKLGTDARTSMGTMERDLRRTDYSSVDIYSYPMATPPGWTTQVPRWAICFVGNDDSQNSTSFDPATGEPIWNKYIIYMATTQTDQGGETALGGAGSGFFLRVVINTDASAANRLPLHNPAFVPAVDSINNEYGGFKSFFAGLIDPWSLVATKCLDQDCTQATNPTFNPFPTAPTMVKGNPVVDAIIKDQYDLQQAQIDAATQSQAAMGNAGIPVTVTSVNIRVIANAFALAYSKDDSKHTVGVTFKTKGYTSRAPEPAQGFESRQIDMTIAAQYYHEK